MFSLSSRQKNLLISFSSARPRNQEKTYYDFRGKSSRLPQQENPLTAADVSYSVAANSSEALRALPVGAIQVFK
jgi:hypothetical protein